MQKTVSLSQARSHAHTQKPTISVNEILYWKSTSCIFSKKSCSGGNRGFTEIFLDIERSQREGASASGQPTRLRTHSSLRHSVWRLPGPVAPRGPGDPVQWERAEGEEPLWKVKEAFSWVFLLWMSSFCNLRCKPISPPWWKRSRRSWRRSSFSSRTSSSSNRKRRDALKRRKRKEKKNSWRITVI